MEKNKPPFLLLVFAGYGNESDHKLDLLDRERKDVEALLESAVEKELCAYKSIASAEVADVRKALDKHGNELTVFHYAGHASAYDLFLRQFSDGREERADPAVLAQYLRRRAPNLQLVVLNGCCTAQQAKHYLGTGIPLVIGTSTLVEDDLALAFSRIFYEQLAAGASFQSAYESFLFERNKLTEAGKPRGLLIDAPAEEEKWALYPTNGAEYFKNLSLPAIAGNCLSFLPDLPTNIHFPPSPYKGLLRFERADARVFFGRSCLIKKIHEALERPNAPAASPLLLLYGQSGVGKSSLLRAGVLPYFEEGYQTEIFARPARGRLVRGLLEQFGVADAAGLHQSWRAREAAANEPILLFVDQVEEVYTTPGSQPAEEMRAFAELLRELLSEPGRIRGKVVLSFREDYLAAVRSDLESVLTWAFQEIRVKRLGVDQVREVVQGLNPRLVADGQPQNSYGIEVTDELAAALARDLSRDASSPVATALQVLLQKFWEETTTERKTQDRVSFDLPLYERVATSGNWIEEFFTEQLADLATVQPKQVASGLVLDLLHYLVTDRVTAAVKPTAMLRERYRQHPPEEIDGLVHELKARALLSDGPAEKEKSVRLTHDVLAGVVNKQYNQSTAPGQLARRLLLSRQATGVGQGTYNKQELALLDAGTDGMPAFSREETATIDASRITVGREKIRRLTRTAGAVFALFLIAAMGWWIRGSSEDDEVRGKLAAADQLAEIDPAEAARGLAVAYRDNPRPEYREKLRDLYHGHIFSTPVSSTGLDLQRVDLFTSSPDGKYFALTDAESFSVKVYVERDGQLELFRELTGPENQLLDLRFGSNTSIVGGGTDFVVHYWDFQNTTESEKYERGDGKRQNPFKLVDASHKDYLVGVDSGNRTFWWRQGETKQGNILESSFPLGVTDIMLRPGSDFVLAATPRGTIQWDLTTGESKIVNTTTQASIRLDEKSQRFVAFGGTTLSWWNQLAAVTKEEVESPNGAAITDVQLAANGNLIVFAAGKDIFLLPPIPGAEPTVLKGHKQDVRHFALAADGRSLLSLSGGEKGGLRRWQHFLDSPLPAYQHPGFAGLSQLTFSPDTTQFLVGDRRGIISRGKVRGEGEAFVVDKRYSIHADATVTVLEYLTQDEVISAGGDRCVKIWTANTGVVQDSIVLPGPVENVFVISQEQMLVTTQDTFAFLWDRQERTLKHLPGHLQPITGILAISDQYVTAGMDGRLLFHDPAFARPPDSIPHPGRLLTGLARQPAGERWVVTTGRDTAYLYDKNQ
ncbi:MAG: AAA family ATPase, partial [Bacteroidota bacterium]